MKRDPTSLGLTIAEKMGIALKHAGVSVTVTSLTDVFAFGVGAVTVSDGIKLKYIIHDICRKCLGLNHSVFAQLLDLLPSTFFKCLGLWLG